MQAVTLTTKQMLALSGQFVPLRRCKNIRWDAAEGRMDDALAYESWLQERLIDLLPYAQLRGATIERARHKRVLRKAKRPGEITIVRYEIIPVVEATIMLIVREPSGVEEWLARGLGPQKAFGYGAFVPVIEALAAVV